MQVVVVLVSFSNMLQKKLFLEEEEGVVSVHNYSTVLKRFFFVTFFSVSVWLNLGIKCMAWFIQ